MVFFESFLKLVMRLFKFLQIAKFKFLKKNVMRKKNQSININIDAQFALVFNGEMSTEKLAHIKRTLNNLAAKKPELREPINDIKKLLLL